MSSLPEPLAACVDIGGTKTLIGLINPEGRVLARDRFPAANHLAPPEQVAQLVEKFHALANGAEVAWERVAGVGYSTAGFLNSERTLVFASPNQGNWRDAPFKALLEEAFHLPAYLEMDANAAALGEAWFGAGRGSQHFVYLIVGTGIGSGIVVNGEVLHGWRGTAGEIGHTTIEPDGPLCNCGNYGCLESLAAGPAIAQRARAAIQQGRKTLITELAGASELSAETVFRAARLQDEVACAILDKEIDYLGIGIANVITLLNPQMVALGGGVAVGGADLLLPPLRRAVRRRCGAWIDLEHTEITLSRLGDEAGLIGAGRLVWQEIQRGTVANFSQYNVK